MLQKRLYHFCVCIVPFQDPFLDEASEIAVAFQDPFLDEV